MPDGPDSEASFCSGSIDSIFQPRREKLAGEVGRPSSRDQKAEGTSWATLRIPRPPDHTGREAWAQARSFTKRSMLAVDPNSFLCSSSDNSNSGERKQGDVRKVYNILGKERTWRSRQRASWAYRCWSLPPNTSRASFFTMTALSTPSAEPMGEPRRVASRESTERRLGATDSMASLVVVSAQINSNLSWFRCNPKSDGALSTKLRS